MVLIFDKIYNVHNCTFTLGRPNRYVPQIYCKAQSSFSTLNSTLTTAINLRLANCPIIYSIDLISLVRLYAFPKIISRIQETFGSVFYTYDYRLDWCAPYIEFALCLSCIKPLITFNIMGLSVTFSKFVLPFNYTLFNYFVFIFN